MSWRPEGWQTIHYSDCSVYNEPAFPKGECDCNSLFEAGADAILEALRETGEHLSKEQLVTLLDPTATATTCFPIPKSGGSYVFIPDEE